MKIWVISFVILGIRFSFIGCTSNSEKSSNVLEIDEAKCAEIEEKFGLEKIKENDESIYWYHYITNLLYDYYSFLSKIDDLSNEKYIINLYSAKEYISVKALNESGFYKNIIKTKFLKEDLQRAKEVFVERHNDVKNILDKIKLMGYSDECITYVNNSIREWYA